MRLSVENMLDGSALLAKTKCDCVVFQHRSIALKPLVAQKEVDI